ncbi:MAG TPA: HAMP domain-containing sensor histidine kinase, partial [Chloroflexota bacterium]
PNVSLLLLQLFMGVLAVTSLAVAAAVEARNRAEEERDQLLVAEHEARGRAEAAIQARDQFLSVASHELKTPVTALKAAADLSLRRQARGALDADSLGRTFALIQKTSGRLASLIDDLLDVSRMRTGHMPLSCGELDLGLLVSRAVEQARDQFGEHHAFTADISCPPNLAWGDADRLEQVLTNLLENAVKYSPTGGEVTLQLQPDAAGLLLTVRDTGIGLPAGAEEVVFEPFGRASNATANRVPGMGLGLYICRDIVQRHGGRIWVESPGEGQGTTAFVWLPRGPVEVAVPAGAIPDHSGDEPEMHVPVEQRRQDQQP